MPIKMNPSDRQVILSNLSELVEGTSDSDFDVLLKNLCSKNVITSWLKNKMLELNCLDDRKRFVYKKVTTRGPGAFDQLNQSLLEAGLKELSLLLQKRRVFREADVDEIDSSIMLKKIAPSKVRMDEDEENVYRMGSRPKGYVLIINIEQYVNNIESKRDGSEKDVDNLTKLWEDLGYEVIKRKNLTTELFKEEIMMFKSMEAHKYVDSAVLFLMSHGDQSTQNPHEVLVKCHDGKTIGSEWVINQFTKGECPNLENKPKMFFFQTCRGRGIEYRYQFDGGIMNAPNMADILVVHPCSPGKLSMRDPYLGSIFVQNICKVFYKLSHDTDLLSMLDEVDKAVRAIDIQPFGSQVVNVDSRQFVKKLYFHPGLYNETYLPQEAGW